MHPHFHDERELAAAIRDGIRRRPEQAFGEYYEGGRASCALGAAYEGIHHLPKDVGHLHPKRMDRLFDCLEGTIRRCPEGCRKSLILGAMIVHLNDDHRWDRERIADWIAEGAPGPEAETPAG